MGGRGPYLSPFRPYRVFARVEAAAAVVVVVVVAVAVAVAARIEALRKTYLCGRDDGPRTRPACS